MCLVFPHRLEVVPRSETKVLRACAGHIREQVTKMTLAIQSDSDQFVLYCPMIMMANALPAALSSSTFVFER